MAVRGPSGVPRLTVQDALAFKGGMPCGYDDCDGQLERRRFKGDEALVCDECGTPAIRTW